MQSNQGPRFSILTKFDQFWSKNGTVMVSLNKLIPKRFFY